MIRNLKIGRKVQYVDMLGNIHPVTIIEVYEKTPTIQFPDAGKYVGIEPLQTNSFFLCPSADSAKRHVKRYMNQYQYRNRDK
jgi:hypothetical protein